jgi:hypothetical protein
MGIWDRLGTVLKSYLADGNETARPFHKSHRAGQGDPDYDEAYEELNEFLRGEKPENKGKNTWEEKTGKKSEEKQRSKKVPPSLVKDFEELGLEADASAEECKEAYKKLLKKHHPDKHHGHPGNLKKATEKTAKINAAYDRIEKWFRDLQ